MKRYLLIFALALGLTSSCDSWLALAPNDGVVEQAYWKSKEDVHAAIIGCYSTILAQDMVSSMVVWGELRGDMVTTSTTARSQFLSIMRGEISPENSFVKWAPFYKVINFCNKAKQMAAQVRQLDQSYTDALLKSDTSEVMVIRAWMYFYLVRSFGDVPLMLNAVNNDNDITYPPKVSGTEVLQYMVKDLTAVINNLPFSYPDMASSRGRFTRFGAAALLADIYLWMADNTHPEYYQEALRYCNMIIESYQYSLIPVGRTEIYPTDMGGTIVDTAFLTIPTDVAEWFNKLYVTGNSAESIFELQYENTGKVQVTNSLFNLFNSTANRPELIANELSLDGSLFPDYEYDRDVKDIRRNWYKASTVWKYVGNSLDGVARNTNALYQNFIIYRFAEILLMKAEVLIEQAILEGNDQAKLTEAYALIKQVRDRANAVDNTSTKMVEPYSGKALEKFLLEERARELLFEGKRWYDVLRFAKRDNFGENGENRQYLMDMAINSAPPEKLASLQTKYLNDWFCYWPIYVNEVDINPNLVQNPFYANQQQ